MYRPFRRDNSRSDLAYHSTLAVAPGQTQRGVAVGPAKSTQQALFPRQNRRQIRGVLTDGRRLVMESKETFYPGMKKTISDALLRAAQYNLILKQLRVALDHTTSKLSYAKRKELFDALDWYGVKSLCATPDGDGKPVFRDLPVGRWPTSDRQEKHAINIFKRLECHQMAEA